jgi:hypothetical protein
VVNVTTGAKWFAENRRAGPLGARLDDLDAILV